MSVLDHENIKSLLLPMIDKQPFDGSNKHISKVDWFKSKDFIDRDWIRLMKPIIDSYNSVMGAAVGYENPSLEVLWYQQYQKANYHYWHTHSGQFVGVYYAELPPNSPKTELVIPFGQNTKIEVDVKEGDIMIFPSCVIHQAPQIKDDNRKTILSWNFTFDGPNRETLNILDNL
jgi:hypothetical protein